VKVDVLLGTLQELQNFTKSIFLFDHGCFSPVTAEKVSVRRLSVYARLICETAKRLD
jgi:hypothetical protein